MNIYVDDTFPYQDYKGKLSFKKIYNCEYEDDENIIHGYQVEYCRDTHIYRVTKFRNYHWDGDVIFEEPTNAYCPVCGKDRFIPAKVGYCYKCGHHLNKQKDWE